MKINPLRLYKRILITQLLSLLFAIISEIHIRLLISNDWLFTNILLFHIEIIILIVIYALLIRFLLDDRWLNVLMISIPYVIYWFLVFAISSKIFPTHTDPDDYGLGLMGVFVSIYQWIGVLIASIVGTYLIRKSYSKDK